MAKKGRKKKIEKTPEQLEVESLKRRIMDVYRNLDYLPEPTRYLKIGDQVEIGFLENATVEKILFNGYAYQINYSSTKTNYGNPIITHNQKNIWNWMNVLPISTKEENLIKNSDIRMSYSQMVVTSLFSRMYNFGVDTTPEYQREYVWTEEDQVSLIDSIFNSVDIGKFTFIKLEDYSKKYLYEVLDGKQRLKALCDFYESRFKYKGFYFHELSSREKDFFEDYSVSIGDVRGNLSMLDKLRIFKLINTTGKSMNEEHLKNIDKMIEKCE